MSEARGNITGFIQKRDGTVFGLKLGQEEYLYSFEDKRGQPFDSDKVTLNSHVRIEWSPFTKDGKEKRYISVLELLDTTSASVSVDTGYRTPDQMQAAKALSEAVLLVNGVTFKVENVEQAVGAVLYAYNEFLNALNGSEAPGPAEMPFE
ncbi:hypothetical protein LCGC14_0676840 [marine sediment metagenome]|uniref:Uncharacterized protein n=1 Tax=marine sediment metagenome TaxID=412755 RepID=A0A0F9QPE0_9ZZZZ